jgi:hypothetical protein
MARRLLVSLGVVLGLIVAVVVAGTAYLALKAPLQSNPSSNLTPQTCSPGPCANLQGYTIWISKVRVDGDLVRMTVKFQNSSPSTHASPEDLTLIDSTRHSSQLSTGATGCKTWQRHAFNNGQTFGPIDICFRVTNTTPPFTLRWAPDEGAFCCEQPITIFPS